MKERLDIEMVERGLVDTRNMAQRLIDDMKVRVNGNIENKCHKIVDTEDEISVDFTNVFVSRGGDKLQYALNFFKIKVKDFVCLDVGASTGGFTDCLLQNGANRVYSVDVGENQLAEKLKQNEKVISFENVDIRELKDLKELVDLIVVDVSFISIEKILLDLAKFLKKDGLVVFLIKPQFEIQGNKNKQGKITNEEMIFDRIVEIKKLVTDSGYQIVDFVASPILGKKGGNVEYLLYAKNLNLTE